MTRRPAPTHSLCTAVLSSPAVGRTLATVTRNARPKFVFPADGLPLYTANRRGEFLIQAGVAVISCMAYGTYALTQYEAKKQTGEFVGSSDTVTKVAIGLGAFCVVTTPLFTWASTRRAVRRLWAVPRSANTNVASALRVETHSFFGGPGKTTDVQISEIVPVGHINPAERLVRFQLRDNKLFVMTRDRGEFHNEEALQRLLNNKPVTFS